MRNTAAKSRGGLITAAALVVAAALLLLVAAVGPIADAHHRPGHDGGPPGSSTDPPSDEPPSDSQSVAFGFNAPWASPNATPPGPGPEWLPVVKTRGMNSNMIAGISWRHFTVSGQACPAFPEPGTSCDTRWQRLDDSLSAHQSEGMTPMVALADSRANSGDDANLVASGEVDVYAEVMKQVTTRYTSPSWCDPFCPIDALQVWNEPNSPGFGGYTVEEYRTLFLAALDAIRSVDSNTGVISGAPSPTVAGWEDYQREIARFPGEFILGAHIYPIQAEPIVSVAAEQYEVSETAVDENGDTRPVRVTEVGVCTGEPKVTCPNKQVYEIDEAQQAEELANVCTMLADRGAEAIMIHTLLASRPGGIQVGFGLWNDVVEEPYFRPAWDAIENCHLGSAGDDGGEETAAFSLSATGYKVKGVQHADLSWSEAPGDELDVYRNGSLIATTANTGAYTDNIGAKGGGSYTYQVCEAGAQTSCSNEAVVTF